jgi:N6-adenosine-specific RNA methylase IME4
MSKKFRVIVADPPWPFADKLKMSDVKRGAEANYHVMTVKDIINLPMKDFIAPDGTVLALWVPSSLLQEGLDTMKAWGFDHKQTYIWVKTKKQPFKQVKNIFLDIWKIYDPFKDKVTPLKFIRSMKNSIDSVVDGKSIRDMLAFGMGRLFRQTHEICLIGTSNGGIYKHLKNKSQRSVSFAPNLKHSAKPEDLQDSLDTMFPTGARLELFARRHRKDWVCLGDEICNGEDIRVSLAKL